MQLTITGYSTALFATWYFIEELGLLFDAGDGLTSGLLQKSRKIKHAFISHADRDHLTGLLQFNQLNARPGFPVIYYPKDSGSFPALETFSKQFDSYVTGTVWKPVAPGDKLLVRDDVFVEPVRNGHVDAKEGLIKSLSYKVMQTKRKLKPELNNLTTADLVKLTQENGKESVSNEVVTCVIGYSGDTPVEDMQRWNNCEVLIHEATFLEEIKPDLHAHGNRHSKLEEVMEMVSALQIQKLILGHFSSRYSPEQIDMSIRRLCEKYAINTQVFRVLPGQSVSDILRQQPLNT